MTIREKTSPQLRRKDLITGGRKVTVIPDRVKEPIRNPIQTQTQTQDQDQVPAHLLVEEDNDYI
jgi:hypothetical protein